MIAGLDVTVAHGSRPWGHAARGDRVCWPDSELGRGALPGAGLGEFRQHFNAVGCDGYGVLKLG